MGIAPRNVEKISSFKYYIFSLPQEVFVPPRR